MNQLKIDEKPIENRVNILGEQLNDEKEYRIYVPLFGGLIKLYVQLLNHIEKDKVSVVFTHKKNADTYESKEEAYRTKTYMETNPNRFVLYKGNMWDAFWSYIMLSWFED